MRTGCMLTVVALPVCSTVHCPIFPLSMDPLSRCPIVPSRHCAIVPLSHCHTAPLAISQSPHGRIVLSSHCATARPVAPAPYPHSPHPHLPENNSKTRISDRLKYSGNWELLGSKLPLEKFCHGRLHRTLRRLRRPQNAVNCSILRERAAGSPPSTNQVSLLFPCWKPEDQRISLVLRFAGANTPKRNSFRNHRHMNWHRIVPWRTVFDEWLTRVWGCCSWQCARPGQHVREPEQAQGDISKEKIGCDIQVPSWRHISCHTDKNRYYT